MKTTNNQRLRIPALCLIILFVIGFFNLQGLSAKNMTLPSGASDVIYQCGEGSAVIDLPTPLPANYPDTATKMLIGVHIDSAPPEYVSVRLYIELWETMPGDTEYEWQPWVEITTNVNSQTLMRQFWGGCATEFNLEAATIYCYLLNIDPAYAPYFTTDNVILATNSVLTAERHGNSIYLSLSAPQQIKQPMTLDTYWTLPAFSLELKATGGSVHMDTTFVMSGWPGAWGGTLSMEQIGFNAVGTCTVPSWGYSGVTVNDGWISMNAKETFYPPA